MSISLYDKDTNRLLGAMTEEDFQVLTDALEEEGPGDHDYFVDLDVLDFLQEQGASEALLGLLRKAVGDSDGIEVRWQRS